MNRAEQAPLQENLKAGSASQRFTLDGSDELEAKLNAVSVAATLGVRRIVPENRLEGLVLGGSYGRGEGGVFRTGCSDLPYNDLEFFTFVNGSCRLNERRYASALQDLSHELSRVAEVEVEFKILSRSKLADSPISMAYHDLTVGHRRLWGDVDLFGMCQHHCKSSLIPRHEATRLLFNRSSGLLFAEARLRKSRLSDEDRSFVGRNHAKAQLGIGDAVLTALGHYDASCRERGRRLQALTPVEGCEWFNQVRFHHDSGVRFKLHPSEPSPSGFETMQRELSDLSLSVWLWIEGHRLGRHFVSALDYAASAENKCSEHPPVRNLLINALVLRRVWPGPFRYPREKLFNSMSLLLWEHNALDSADSLKRLQRELGTSASTYPELINVYERLWHRFN